MFRTEVDVFSSRLPVRTVVVDPVEGLHPFLPPLRLLLLVGEDTEGKLFVGHHIMIGAPHGGTVLGHLGDLCSLALCPVSAPPYSRLSGEERCEISLSRLFLIISISPQVSEISPPSGKHGRRFPSPAVLPLTTATTTSPATTFQ